MKSAHHIGKYWLMEFAEETDSDKWTTKSRKFVPIGRRAASGPLF